MTNTVPGPTYEEMLHPELLPAAVRSQALFNITWRGADSRIRHIVLPKELTGVEANIVVLTGRDFPRAAIRWGRPTPR